MAGFAALRARLNGGLWHTTRPDRFKTIMATGALKPEPNIPDAERWKASLGPEYHPYVRMIGGVSLFDFQNFDPEIYDQSYPLSSWRTFVPHQEGWGCAVWIEIDREMTAAQFVSAAEVVAGWKRGGHYRHTIMPRLEAACIGEVLTSAFKSAFLTWSHGLETREVKVSTFEETEFDELLRLLPSMRS